MQLYVIIVAILDFCSYLLRQIRYRLFPRHHSIRGWNVLVTGAASGMGRATAVRLAELGVSHVYALDRNKESLLRLKRECAAIMGFEDGCIPIVCDLRNGAEIQRTVDLLTQSITKSGAKLNAVVNAAGMVGLGPLVDEHSDLDEELNSMIDVNVRAPMKLCKGLFPLINKQSKKNNIKGSRFIFVTSAASFSRLPYMGLYAMSEGMVEVYVDTLRRELAPFGIGVVSVIPTAIDTSVKEPGQQYSNSVFKEYLHKTYAFLSSLRPAYLPASAVANTVIETLALEHPKPRYLVDKTPWYTWFLFGVPDQLADWFLSRLIFGRKAAIDLIQ